MDSVQGSGVVVLDWALVQVMTRELVPGPGQAWAQCAVPGSLLALVKALVSVLARELAPGSCPALAQ